MSREMNGWEEEDINLEPVEKIVYRSKSLTIGSFRCPVSFPWFGNTGPTSGNLLVFPRTSVFITHQHQDPVVANPNVVMYYNAGDRYLRGKISERGDLCEWFEFSSQVLVEAIQSCDPWVNDRVERPFTFTYGPSDPSAYLLQRVVVEHIYKNPVPDRLFVEETMFAVLARAVASAYRLRRQRAQRRAPYAEADHRDLTRHVQVILAERFREKLTLDELGAEVNTSPFHLSRVFRKQTGMPIHQYLNQLRLRISLEYLPGKDTDLTDLALSLGYSSHSHFSSAFRRAFGRPPSEMRAAPAVSHSHQMSNFLTA